ncbi:hypothetical protein QAD02_015975 [Eretmocerus hayati]|uniref:Uncharacterized protein n=1 Tax=Eretmocerus hayati TaxID=131215 RepID=A0ACC2PAQ9_9HYME|nr:hypothetical protein QAD02_015975 [Eretmocerus hayati]
MAMRNLSPESMKRKNVNAARRIKNGSPKIREVLRQRCRQRIHERRDELLSKRRLGLEDCTSEVQDLLTGIVHEEFENMVTTEWNDSAHPESPPSNSLPPFTLNQRDHSQGEADTFDIEEDSEEQWILEEYQKMLWEQNQLSSILQDEVICPICLTRSLSEIGNSVVCDCGLRIPVQNGLYGLRQNIQVQINAHSEKCLDIPRFSIFQDIDSISLCFSCLSCDALSLV